MNDLSLKILFPMYCTGSGVSYTCLSLAGAMQKAGAGMGLFMCAADRELGRSYLHTAVPGWMKAAVYKIITSQKAIRSWTEMQFLRQARPGDIVYLWPGISLAAYRKLKDKGCVIVMERINCHRKTARRLLDEAYQNCGLPAAHGITDADIAGETEKLMLADFVFSPSPMVAASLLEAGIDEKKIIDTSYGWDPQRHTPREHVNSGGITVLFVGRLCLRKGVHLLLEAWKQAGIPGRLVLAGFLEQEIKKLCAGSLAPGNVVLPGFVRDVAGLYAEADIFAFPSLEEGGPQVTYEAMACGLPVIVSPMGAGAAARDGQDGYVIEPYDSAGWTEALHKLSADAALRVQMGNTARSRAQEFVWENVGRLRLEALARALNRSQP